MKRCFTYFTLIPSFVKCLMSSLIDNRIPHTQPFLVNLNWLRGYNFTEGQEFPEYLYLPQVEKINLCFEVVKTFLLLIYLSWEFLRIRNFIFDAASVNTVITRRIVLRVEDDLALSSWVDDVWETSAVSDFVHLEQRGFRGRAVKLVPHGAVIRCVVTISSFQIKHYILQSYKWNQ